MTLHIISYLFLFIIFGILGASFFIVSFKEILDGKINSKCIDGPPCPRNLDRRKYFFSVWISTGIPEMKRSKYPFAFWFAIIFQLAIGVFLLMFAVSFWCDLQSGLPNNPLTNKSQRVK